MALTSAPRTPWIVLVIRFRGVRGVGREKREAALKNIAWVWAQFGRWALHCTCIYGTLGKMVLALGAEGFGKKAGWDGGWDAMVVGCDGGGAAGSGSDCDAATTIPTRHGHKFQPHGEPRLHQCKGRAKRESRELAGVGSIEQAPKRSALTSDGESIFELVDVGSVPPPLIPNW